MISNVLRTLSATSALGLGLVALTATPAAAQFGGSAPAPTDVPHCARSIGTASIAPPQREWWLSYGLSNPEQLIKLMAQRSGCLRIVDRGAGLQMRGVERELGSSGELQRRSNVGAGQVRAADFTIIPDIADANNNQSGGGAALGGLLGGRAGAFLRHGAAPAGGDKQSEVEVSSRKSCPMV